MSMQLTSIFSMIAAVAQIIAVTLSCLVLREQRRFDADLKARAADGSHTKDR